ncbi:NAD(P)-dependent oxidoreductase [Balamuthia mandrillaris]
MEETREKPSEFPKQQQELPGLQEKMTPRPQTTFPSYQGSNKLKGRVALVTGGDSGIGQAVCVLFAREGANVVVSYLEEEEKDAQKTKELVEKEGCKALLCPGDISQRQHCFNLVEKTINEFGKLDILVNNAAVQYVQENLEDISEGQLEKTFRTNIFSMFFLAQAALKHMKEGGCIINSSSVNAFKGHAVLIDYTATKGAIQGFTRSLAQNLAPRGIRVNAVAPGPIWTPLIPGSFEEEKVAKFGQNTLLGRAGQPEEVAPSYVFLASADASYMTGQTLHPNGGYIVNA